MRLGRKSTAKEVVEFFSPEGFPLLKGKTAVVTGERQGDLGLLQ